MSEVVISRRGGSGSSKGILMTEYITDNRIWIVPNAVNQQFNVRIIGGGSQGRGESYRGGASGFMNNDLLKLNEGEHIQVTIGRGGWFYNRRNYTLEGETTTFGSYLSASGGGSGGGGSGGGLDWQSNRYPDDKPTSIQFGGGGGGEDGGVWGGGGGASMDNDSNANICGGNGGKYGGGGGGGGSSYVFGGWYYGHASAGGNGGQYGGGGGGGVSKGGDLDYKNNITLIRISDGGNGGQYGGNGSKINDNYNGRIKRYAVTQDIQNYITNAIDGTNTLDLSLKDDYKFPINGSGMAGTTNFNTYNFWSYGCGGGGYGGNGGTVIVPSTYDFGATTNDYPVYGDPIVVVGGAGGGGYGSNGGNGMINSIDNAWASISFMGGGGGGYGGDGQDSTWTIYVNNSWHNSFGVRDCIGGGGGGYGKVSIGRDGAGGGYYCPGGGLKRLGGGGGIGVWNRNTLIASYGSGSYEQNAENGACIIQYYLKPE